MGLFPPFEGFVAFAFISRELFVDFAYGQDIDLSGSDDALRDICPVGYNEVITGSRIGPLWFSK